MASRWSEFYRAMQREFPRAKVLARGIVGASSGASAARFPGPGDDWFERPDLVIFLAGVNDPAVDPEPRLEEAVRNIDSVLEKARAANITIKVGTPLVYPSHSPESTPAEPRPCSTRWSGSYNRALRARLLDGTRPEVIDFDQAMPSDESAELLQDCLHPNEEGGRRMAALVRSKVCTGPISLSVMTLCHPTRTGFDKDERL